MKPETMIDFAAGAARFAVNRHKKRLSSQALHGLSGPANQDAIDRYTIGHVALGTMLGLASVPWWVTLGQAVLWELVETPLKRRLPQVFPVATPDSFANSFFDVAGCMAGWAAMRMLPPGPTPDIWLGGRFPG